MTAKELIREIEQYITQKGDARKGDPIFDQNNNGQIYRLIVGLSGYPNGSNLSSFFDKYQPIGQVAFFSTKSMPDLFFVLAILFGNMKESYNLISTINSKTKKSAVSWNDVIEYLAAVKHYYFVNCKDKNFTRFIAQFSNKSVKCLVTSKSLSVIKKINSIPCLISNAATIIHPSTRNLNGNAQSWIKQFMLTKYTGNIGNVTLRYEDFQL